MRRLYKEDYPFRRSTEKSRALLPTFFAKDQVVTHAADWLSRAKESRPCGQFGAHVLTIGRHVRSRA
jgi:hypothetical protein